MKHKLYLEAHSIKKVKNYIRKAFISITLISLAGCGNMANETPAQSAPLPTLATAPELDLAAIEAAKTIMQEEITGEITVSVFAADNTGFLKQAIKLFEEKYPGTKVNLEVFGSSVELIYGEDEDGNTRVEGVKDIAASAMELDYIKRLNTEIMSGKGADILQIDVIPWYKYADAGYLEDFHPFIDLDASFDKDAMRMNFFDAVMYKGGVYIFPLSAYFDFFAYDAKFFNDGERKAIGAKDAFTFGELVNIAKDAFKRNDGSGNMFSYTGIKKEHPDWYWESTYPIWDELLWENYGSFVDMANKQARFDDGRFESLLSTVGEYVKKGYITDDPEIIEARYNYINRDERFFYKKEIDFDLVKGFLKMDPGYSYSPEYGIRDNDFIGGMAADYNGNIPLRATRNTYAINSNSANKRTAWEFIKFLASEEAEGQGVWAMYGITPINRNTLEKREKERFALIGLVKYPSMDIDHDIIDYDAYIECLNKYADMINTHTIHDWRIDKWIDEEATLYYDGEKSAKDAAKVIQNKVKLYFSE